MTIHSPKSILESLGSQPIRDAADLRAKLVPELKKLLDRGHQEAQEKLQDSQNGLVCARYLCDRMDELVHIVHDAVVQHLYPAANPSAGERLAVVATGGYGRGTLAPGSDVDLLFLLPYKQTAWGESVVEAMLYVLWDLKLKVGHATRSVEECLREAHADMTIRTSLLEARFLFGNRELFDNLEKRFDQEIVATTAAEFVDAKLKERDGRVAKAGASRYLVEPNVKDGKGGLRDLNTLFWIAKYVYRVKEPRELVKAGLFTQAEFNLFSRCEEFLWRVRCHLHFVTGRAEERLTFDLQRTIAERLGFAPRGGLSAVERFMKAYFLIAKDVGDLTAIVCAELEARQTKRRPMLDRMFGRFRRRSGGALVSEGFIIDNNRLNVENEEAFERDPVNLIRLFWLADRRNLAIHPDATRRAARSLKLLGHNVRNDPEANKLFLEILSSKNAPEVVLRRMNETGVLGRFIPDFGRIVAMMQFNMYHHYTVDEHLIRSVGVLTEIEAGQLGSEHPLANQIFPTIRNRRALYVAMFLHDIAKGRPEDHSEAGAVIARKLGPRFGLTEAETDTVAWLVEHHLLMSNTAQSRDLSDPATIKSFAEVVQTMERLKLLLVLTIADIKAVGPGTWTGWKGQLLRNLYQETEVILGGGAVDLARSERVRLVQEQLRAELPDWSDAEFETYASRHTPGYWLKTDETRRAKQARLLRESDKAGRTVTTAYETDQFRGVTELTILSPDHPRLLAIVTGACAASGGNIVDAQIFTTTDGIALDTIVLSRAFDRDEDELRRAERVAKAIERALKGEVKIADLVDGKRPAKERSKAFHVPPEVSIDNSLSNRQTVIEISGLDRPGLLYDLTTALGKLNLNIASAHIVTFGEKAVDVFYVTDLTGTKITHAGRQATISRTLLDVFKSEETEPLHRRSA
ncbi:[protein-PII] uridylyltransferase [Microvirga tunisiensis]|uniref:Bifunctional uridylyltransferase/uridylyl-removing enzyme n=1 Tax=Microvirga tunisiensis TaxID=2108360 RepID=A0A5N7MFB9_9HYPH|nr:[protein-PII] uridylyltransferase [Microvirga tunisiensis]MPR07132.1 [protein-PII] uridylyltransferase [Microvirga tunisiensis]MPR25380.1 [protein-PII] uridylyltransferase [Microvirga tunisiensis]